MTGSNHVRRRSTIPTYYPPTSTTTAESNAASPPTKPASSTTTNNQTQVQNYGPQLTTLVAAGCFLIVGQEPMLWLLIASAAYLFMESSQAMNNKNVAEMTTCIHRWMMFGGIAVADQIFGGRIALLFAVCAGFAMNSQAKTEGTAVFSKAAIADEIIETAVRRISEIIPADLYAIAGQSESNIQSKTPIKSTTTPTPRSRSHSIK